MGSFDYGEDPNDLWQSTEIKWHIMIDGLAEACISFYSMIKKGGYERRVRTGRLKFGNTQNTVRVADAVLNENKTNL